MSRKTGFSQSEKRLRDGECGGRDYMGAKIITLNENRTIAIGDFLVCVLGRSERRVMCNGVGKCPFLEVALQD